MFLCPEDTVFISSWSLASTIFQSLPPFFVLVPETWGLEGNIEVPSVAKHYIDMHSLHFDNLWFSVVLSFEKGSSCVCHLGLYWRSLYERAFSSCPLMPASSVLWLTQWCFFYQSFCHLPGTVYWFWLLQHWHNCFSIHRSDLSWWGGAVLLHSKFDSISSVKELVWWTGLPLKIASQTCLIQEWSISVNETSFMSRTTVCALDKETPNSSF